MADDSLDVLDIESDILTGEIDVEQADDPRGKRFVIIGKATDLGTPVAVVARFVGNDQLLIITVYEVKSE